MLCLRGIFLFCLHVTWSWIFLELLMFIMNLFSSFNFFEFYSTPPLLYVPVFSNIHEFFRLYMFAYPLCVTSNSGFRFRLTTELIEQDRPHSEVNVFTFKKKKQHDLYSSSTVEISYIPDRTCICPGISHLVC